MTQGTPKKISELPLVSDVVDGSYVPVVVNGVTSRADYVAGSLLQDVLDNTLPAQARTQQKGAALLKDPTNGRNIVDHDRVDVREYGANVGGIQRTTATGTAGLAAVVLANAKNYKDGNWLMLSGLGAAHGMATPGAPALAVQGTTGASTVSVKVIAITSTGGYTPASTATTVTTANATLSETNFVEVWCAPVASAYRYLIYVQFGGSGAYTYFGGVIAHPQYDAIGRAEAMTFRIVSNTPPTAPAWLPSTVPATGLANGLRTQILTGGGTTAITVFPVPITSGAGVNCDACSLIPIEDAINSDPDGYSTHVQISRGTQYVTGPLQIRSPVYLCGANSGHVQAGGILLFRDGCGISTYNQAGAEQWQPGTMYRLRDRVVSQLRTGAVGSWTLTAIAAGATWGVSGTTEPTWNYTPAGTTSDNGHTWTFQQAGYSGAGCAPEYFGIQCEGKTIPANRVVVEDDLRNGVQHLSGNGGAAAVWSAALTPTLDSYYVPTDANVNGKLYKATAVAGATAGAEPTWPKVIGATVVDNGVTWTCVDVLRRQGAGFLFAAVTRGKFLQITGFGGTGLLGDGNSYSDGGAISLSVFEDIDVRSCTGHHVAIYGSDASGCTLKRVSCGQRFVVSGGACIVQDNGLYGNYFELFSHDGGARYQNQPWTSSVQIMSKLNDCYVEGLSGSDTDWNLPGKVDDGHHASGFRTGSNALLNGVALSVANLSQARDSARLISDETGTEPFTWFMTGGVERKLWGAGTVALRTLLQEQHDSQLVTKGRSRHTVRGSTFSVRETAHFDGRGIGEIFPEDLRVGGNFANEGRFGNLNAYPTKGVFSSADWYTWNPDNRRIALKPARVGQIGATARANSTAYAGPGVGVSGDIVTTGGFSFVCVCGGTSAGSLPGAFAAAALGDFVVDGTAIFQKWTTAQDPNITAVPNLWADTVAVTDADQTLAFTSGNNGQSCRDFPAITANRAIALGTTGVLGGDCYFLRQKNVVPYTITISTVEGGSIVFPANTRYAAVIRCTIAGTFELCGAGPLDGETSGVATLVAGVSAAIAAPISANSVIVCTLKTPNTDALTVKYAALGADRVNGAPGSFKISALDATGGGAINALDVSTLDWRVIK